MNIAEILQDERKFLFIVLFFVGAVDLLAFSYFYLRSKRFLERSRQVKAKILAVTEENGRKNLRVTFPDSLGKTVETSFYVIGKSIDPSAETIDILSDKDSPANVRQDTFQTLWLVPVFMLMGASVILALLVYLYINGAVALPF